MDQKQLWITVVLAIIVAGVVAYLVAVSASPGFSPGMEQSAIAKPATTTQPDLIVSDISMYGSHCVNVTNSTQNCNANFSVSVQNIGGSNAGASHTFLQLIGPPFGGASVELATGALSSGQTRVLFTSFAGLRQGLYTATGTADSRYVISESNENNNNLTSVFYVG